MRVLTALAAIVTLLLACAPDGEVRLHEVVLYGSENSRITWFYGSPTTLLLGDEEVSLGRGQASDDPLAVSDSLTVAGRPYLREPVARLTQAPIQVLTIPRSSDLRVRVAADTGRVLYFDGAMWFELLGDGRPGMDVRVVPRPIVGSLPAFGEMSRAETRAVAAHLESGGPLALAVLDEIAAPPRTGDGTDEYSRTALFVQREFAAAAQAQRAGGEQLVWEVLAEGNQAVGFERPTFHLVSGPDSLLNLWNRAHGSQLQVPPLPEVDFARETVVALFMGTRPTGGYRFEPQGVSVEGGELFVDVRVVEPAPDAITTQALTSPWSMVRILRGGFQAAWVRDADSREILGAALPQQ